MIELMMFVHACFMEEVNNDSGNPKEKLVYIVWGIGKKCTQGHYGYDKLEQRAIRVVRGISDINSMDWVLGWVGLL